MWRERLDPSVSNLRGGVVERPSAEAEMNEHRWVGLGQGGVGLRLDCVVFEGSVGGRKNGPGTKRRSDISVF